MKYTSLLIYLLILGIGLPGCKSQKEIINLQPEALPNALLWKLESDAAEQPSYLFGTIHIIGGDDFFYPNGTLAAIDGSEHMVFEVDMAEMNDMGNIMGLMNKAMMSDDLELSDLMDSTEYAMVEDHFREMGLPLMMFKRMKPMFLTVFAGGDMNPMDIQSGKIKSYEMEFMKIAEQSNMSSGGLETLDYQISVFDSIPYSAQADMLLDAIKAGDTAGDQFQEMIDIYKRQDLDALVSMIDSDSGLDSYNDLLLKNRNENWIPQMLMMMKQQPTFFAVGAGHLAGEYGVLNLLKKEGVRISPVSGE